MGGPTAKSDPPQMAAVMRLRNPVQRWDGCRVIVVWETKVGGGALWAAEPGKPRQGL